MVLFNGGRGIQNNAKQLASKVKLRKGISSKIARRDESEEQDHDNPKDIDYAPDNSLPSVAISNDADKDMNTGNHCDIPDV